ncbi:hypothetical protein K474DRAFT_1710928 [Panus rudis PR-1116 ss-1]|nr:hypothetical protein K474DRAFT_1710928 [Panus rudis PR-1116 ss-1]
MSVPQSSNETRPEDVSRGSWKEVVVSELKKADEKKIKDIKEDIDTLLVFAGLFSAVVTAFTVEFYKRLQPDTSNATVFLLATIAQQLNNSLDNMSLVDSFKPVPESSTSRGFIGMWFASLFLSLATASLGMLAKQWLREFLAMEDGPRGFFLRHSGLSVYRVYEFTAFLPMLLQLALILFLVGLFTFLHTLDPTIGWIITGLVTTWLLIYAASFLGPLLDYSCPYRTPVIAHIQHPAHTTIRYLLRPLCVLLLSFLIIPTIVENHLSPTKQRYFSAASKRISEIWHWRVEQPSDDEHNRGNAQLGPPAVFHYREPPEYLTLDEIDKSMVRVMLGELPVPAVNPAIRLSIIRCIPNVARSANDVIQWVIRIGGMRAIPPDLRPIIRLTLSEKPASWRRKSNEIVDQAAHSWLRLLLDQLTEYDVPTIGVLMQQVVALFVKESWTHRYIFQFFLLLGDNMAFLKDHSLKIACHFDRKSLSFLTTHMLHLTSVCREHAVVEALPVYTFLLSRTTLCGASSGQPGLVPIQQCLSLYRKHLIQANGGRPKRWVRERVKPDITVPWLQDILRLHPDLEFEISTLTSLLRPFLDSDDTLETVSPNTMDTEEDITSFFSGPHC